MNQKDELASLRAEVERLTEEPTVTMTDGKTLLLSEVGDAYEALLTRLEQAERVVEAAKEHECRNVWTPLVCPICQAITAWQEARDA